MKLILNIFFSLICFMSVLSPISAEENPQFIYGGTLDPYSTPMLLDASTIIEFDNSNMCIDWDSLTDEQQSAITSNIGLNNFNFAFITDDNILYLGRAIWCSSSSNGVYSFHSESNVSNNGFYIVDSNGSLSKSVELGEFSINSIFYSQYRVGSLWFEDYDIRTSDCAVVVNPVNPPSLTLPPSNKPTQIVNSTQSNYIQSISSPKAQGGYINALLVDYYNLYSVVQTAETDKFFDNINDNYYIYQAVEGVYIYPVYTHSIITVYAPNMTVATVPFSISAVNVGDTSFSYPMASGIIQRDVNKFEYEYVDLITYQSSKFETLPFDNSSDNQNHIEYLGTKSQSYFIGSSSSSVDFTINNNGVNINLFFVATDSYDTIQIATNNNNQSILNNNLTDGFVNLDNVLQHGNTLTQNSQTAVNNINNQFNDSYDRYQAIEQGLIDEYNNNLDSIDLDTYKISNNLDLINTANFVRTQFDRLTLNNPIGLTIGFSLCVGLALLLIGKRL